MSQERTVQKIRERSHETYIERFHTTEGIKDYSVVINCNSNKTSYVIQ